MKDKIVIWIKNHKTATKIIMFTLIPIIFVIGAVIFIWEMVEETVEEIAGG
jgi:hypothetical protein